MSNGPDDEEKKPGEGQPGEDEDGVSFEDIFNLDAQAEPEAPKPAEPPKAEAPPVAEAVPAPAEQAPPAPEGDGGLDMSRASLERMLPTPPVPDVPYPIDGNAPTVDMTPEDRATAGFPPLPSQAETVDMTPTGRSGFLSDADKNGKKAPFAPIESKQPDAGEEKIESATGIFGPDPSAAAPAKPDVSGIDEEAATIMGDAGTGTGAAPPRQTVPGTEDTGTASVIMLAQSPEQRVYGIMEAGQQRGADIGTVVFGADAQFIPQGGTWAGRHFAGEKYEVLMLLGEGGMAPVYLAKCIRPDVRTRKNELIALKLIPVASARDYKFQRMQREANAVRELGDHENIVGFKGSDRVLEVNPSSDRMQKMNFFYVAMEYVEHPPLFSRLGVERRLSTDEALNIIYLTGKGIKYAHDKDVVHRDIKVENIYYTKDGKVKVGDLGLARFEKDTSKNVLATGEQTPMGTPEDMAPEQARGEFGDEKKIDIYLIASSAMRLISGSPTRTKPTGMSTTAFLLDYVAQETDPPRLEERIENVDPHVAGMLAAMQSGKQDDRYTIDEFLYVVGSIMESRSKSRAEKEAERKKAEEDVDKWKTEKINDVMSQQQRIREIGHMMFYCEGGLRAQLIAYGKDADVQKAASFGDDNLKTIVAVINKDKVGTHERDAEAVRKGEEYPLTHDNLIGISTVVHALKGTVELDLFAYGDVMKKIEYVHEALARAGTNIAKMDAERQESGLTDVEYEEVRKWHEDLKKSAANLQDKASERTYLAAMNRIVAGQYTDSFAWLHSIEGKVSDSAAKTVGASDIPFGNENVGDMMKLAALEMQITMMLSKEYEAEQTAHPGQPVNGDELMRKVAANDAGRVAMEGSVEVYDAYKFPGFERRSSQLKGYIPKKDEGGEAGKDSKPEGPDPAPAPAPADPQS